MVTVTLMFPGLRGSAAGDYDLVTVRMKEEACITCPTGFVANCTNVDLLDTSYHEFVLDEGPIGSGDPLHVYVSFNFIF